MTEVYATRRLVVAATFVALLGVLVLVVRSVGAAEPPRFALADGSPVVASHDAAVADGTRTGAWQRISPELSPDISVASAVPDRSADAFDTLVGGALPAERRSTSAAGDDDPAPNAAAPAPTDPDGDDPAAETTAETGGEDTPAPRAPQVPGRTADAVLPVLDPDTIATVAARTGIPDRALAAYASAARLLADEQPSCGVTWSTLAGIGWVESRHGNYRGARLREDGVPTEPIIGIPLDGGPNVRAIPDTDGGRLDGDTTWDRAVGPMQFIPSTWARWGADGSGHGAYDPQHIDDAALAAARYLCASGGDLTEASGWWRAVLTYNRSETYAHHVLQAANTYARRSHG